MNKTGTKSLEAAVEILGFTTADTGKQTSSLMLHALEEGRPLLDLCPPRVAAADAYFDCRPIERNFDVVDSQYPGSKFILHTRDLEGWLESREKHVLRNQRAAAEGAYHGSWLKVDRETWTREWHEHHRLVRDYFAGRDDFLEFDIAAGDGWETLAPFLGCPVPDVPMPWENAASRAPATHGTIASGLTRLGSVFRRL